MPHKRKRPPKSPWKQGVFTPKNGERCLNKNCIYRSRFELKVMQWLDNDPNVIRWGSESLALRYINPLDGRFHRYYPDFIVIKLVEGKPQKVIIEVKPKKHTIKPKITKRKKKSTIIQEQKMWAINQAKWQVAEAYCERHGYKFMIVTEDQLFKDKGLS